jgi:hypothetical protein
MDLFTTEKYRLLHAAEEKDFVRSKSLPPPPVAPVPSSAPKPVLQPPSSFCAAPPVPVLSEDEQSILFLRQMALDEKREEEQGNRNLPPKSVKVHPCPLPPK